MSSTGTFLAFGTVMLVVALLGVAIDWFGKPMRHRKFIPKIYRYPDERHRRPPAGPILESSAPFQAAATPVLPARSASGARAIDLDEVATPIAPAPFEPAPGPQSDAGPTAAPSFDDLEVDIDADRAPTLITVEDLAQVGDAGGRAQGWSAGGDVYNLTASGNEPSPSTVRARYWRNVGAAPGAAMFGAENVRRMSEGKAPRRRNARSGKSESMRLPSVDYIDSGGKTPVPSWPETSIDPFS